MKSKTHEQILNMAVTGSYDNDEWITQELGDSHCYSAMDTYAKQQAEAVIKELEEELKNTSILDNSHDTLEYAINIIKKHFNIV